MEAEIVVVGTSRGGLNALKVLLGGLPREFSPPVAIVQHRDRNSSASLCELLQRASALPVTEAGDKEPIAPGHVYLAPVDYHLLVEDGLFSLSKDAPVWHARPSIDVLFESAADAYGNRALGVILSGGGQDGARGLARISGKGGSTVVQEPATAEDPAMPQAAIAAVSGHLVVPLPEIAAFLVKSCLDRKE